MEKRNRYLGLESALIGDALRKLHEIRDHFWGSVKVIFNPETEVVEGYACCLKCGQTLEYETDWGWFTTQKPLEKCNGKKKEN
jgi:hypothetical protein